MYEGRMDSFERNRYFYGKLLTAQDFIAEQEYFMDKRRLISRVLFGSGVVCGMDVVGIDETTISVESGLALDASGREIIIGQPHMKKLSSIEGFDTLTKTADEGDAIKSAYLCVEYREEKSEPVYSVAHNAEDDETSGPEYNKIAESYGLFLTTAEPAAHPSLSHNAAFCETVVWDDGVVRITQTLPRFLSAGEEFFLQTRILKGASRRPIRFSCRLDLSFLTADGQHFADIQFEEPELPEQRDIFVINTRLRAYSQQREAAVRVSGAEITIGTERKSGREHRMKANIVPNAQNALLQSYWDMPLQKYREECPVLYLARLQLIVTPSSYSIEHIENRPFLQTVLTSPQVQSVYRAARLEASPECKPEQQTMAAATESEEQARSGAVTINLPAGAKKDSIYLSNPTPHGLGPGMVFINACLNSGEHVLSGSGVFDSPFSWGVKVNKADGTFQIGVRLREDMPADNLSFSWRAERQADTVAAAAEKLTLSPGVYYAARKETVRLEAALSSGARWRRGELKFSVRPEAGASISDIGVFTSLDQPGIFEITVQHVINTELRASAFVVVK